MDSQNSFLDLARPWADRGFKTIPVPVGGKNPVWTGWPDMADALTIEQLAAQAAADTRFAEWNAGIVASYATHCVLDCDAEGLVERIERETGQQMPRTLTVKSGGRETPHYYFLHTERTLALEKCAKSTGEFDFWMNRMQTLAPGSLHKSGRRYEIAVDAPLVPIPDWLLDWIIAAERTYATGSGAADDGALAQLKDAYYQNCDPADMIALPSLDIAACQHPTMLAIAGLLHDGERTADEIADVLGDLWARHCCGRQPGEGELERLAHHACSGEPCRVEPRNLPTYCVWPWVFRDAETMAKWIAENVDSLQIRGVEKPDGPAVEFNPWEYALKPLALPDQEFSGWFPRGRLTLISGASGAMKTTFIAQALVAARDGEEFLGHAPGELPFFFLFADRGKWDAEETFIRMKMQGQIPYACMNGTAPDEALRAIVAAAKSDYKIIFLDGGDLLVGDNNDGRSVGSLTTGIQRIAEHYGVGFIISTGAAKLSAKALKEGAERRTMTKGSEVWGRTSGTLFTLNSEHDGTQATRRLVVQHRNAATERFLLELQQGRLVAIDEDAKQERESDMAMLNWISTRDEFRRQDLATAFRHLSGATINKRIEGLIRGGFIMAGKQYKYVVVRGRDVS